jgi:hypothetical protein
MRKVLGGDLEERRMITATSSTSPMTKQSRTEEKLEFGAPSTCFAYRGARMWNEDSGMSLLSSKATAKATIKRKTIKFPI